MGKTISFYLSEESVRNAARQLQAYSDGLQAKCDLFAKRLMERGISVAKANTGNFGKYIVFQMQTQSQGDGCKGILYATQTGFIKSQWKTKDGIESRDVSPLLMAEFGSGRYAENPMKVDGVGQGTFPEQTHAFDANGWYWQDAVTDEWHHSYGINPSAPMYKAYLAMEEQLLIVAREVFGDG